MTKKLQEGSLYEYLDADGDGVVDAGFDVLQSLEQTCSDGTGSPTFGCPDGYTLCEGDVFDIEGCTDETACNYNEDATIDNDSCVYPNEDEDCDGNIIAGCTDPDACNYGGESIIIDDGSCYYENMVECY